MARPDYEARMTRLAAASERRTQEAVARAQRAINALRSGGEAVNFNTVARAGSVSKDFLYSHDGLSQQIRDLRKQATPAVARPEEERPSPASATTQLTVLRHANEALREENRQLREANEALRGELLRVRGALGG